MKYRGQFDGGWAVFMRRLNNYGRLKGGSGGDEAVANERTPHVIWLGTLIYLLGLTSIH